MDISDILASVTRDANSALGIDTENEQQQQDLQLLTRAWISERVSPELRSYPTQLMDRVMTRLRAQVSCKSARKHTGERRLIGVHHGQEDRDH